MHKQRAKEQQKADKDMQDMFERDEAAHAQRQAAREREDCLLLENHSLCLLQMRAAYNSENKTTAFFAASNNQALSRLEEKRRALSSLLHSSADAPASFDASLQTQHLCQGNSEEGKRRAAAEEQEELAIEEALLHLEPFYPSVPEPELPQRGHEFYEVDNPEKHAPQEEEGAFYPPVAPAATDEDCGQDQAAADEQTAYSSYPQTAYSSYPPEPGMLSLLVAHADKDNDSHSQAQHPSGAVPAVPAETASVLSKHGHSALAPQGERHYAETLSQTQAAHVSRVALHVGMRVMLSGLAQRPDLDSCVGRIVRQGHCSKWIVALQVTSYSPSKRHKKAKARARQETILVKVHHDNITPVQDPSGNAVQTVSEAGTAADTRGMPSPASATEYAGASELDGAWTDGVQTEKAEVRHYAVQAQDSHSTPLVSPPSVVWLKVDAMQQRVHDLRQRDLSRDRTHDPLARCPLPPDGAVAEYETPQGEGGGEEPPEGSDEWCCEEVERSLLLLASSRLCLKTKVQADDAKYALADAQLAPPENEYGSVPDLEHRVRESENMFYSLLRCAWNGQIPAWSIPIESREKWCGVGVSLSLGAPFVVLKSLFSLDSMLPSEEGAQPVDLHTCVFEGDVILAVGDIVVDHLEAAEVQWLLKGPAGSTVCMTVLRDQKKIQRELSGPEHVAMCELRLVRQSSAAEEGFTHTALPHGLSVRLVGLVGQGSKYNGQEGQVLPASHSRMSSAHSTPRRSANERERILMSSGKILHVKRANLQQKLPTGVSGAFLAPASFSSVPHFSPTAAGSESYAGAAPRAMDPSAPKQPVMEPDEPAPVRLEHQQPKAKKTSLAQWMGAKSVQKPIKLLQLAGGGAAPDEARIKDYDVQLLGLLAAARRKGFKLRCAALRLARSSCACFKRVGLSWFCLSRPACA